MLDFARVSGDFAAPELVLTAPVYVDSTQFTDETVGDGLKITSDAQDVMFSVSFVNGVTGAPILSSGTQVQPLSFWHENYAGLATMMMCATEGSRIVGAVPYDEISEDAATQLGLTEGQSMAVVLDVEKVYLASANGVSQYNDRRGMPSVVLAPDGRPGVIIPDTTAPSELVVEVLKKGDGAEVTADDIARVHSTAVNWDTRNVVSSTWDDGASQAVSASSDVAFAAQLVGATVGSQLLIVAPPTSADASATVYVVDVLGIDDPATATQ